MVHELYTPFIEFAPSQFGRVASTAPVNEERNFVIYISVEREATSAPTYNFTVTGLGVISFQK
jgi:hypothetical protein